MTIGSQKSHLKELNMRVLGAVLAVLVLSSCTSKLEKEYMGGCRSTGTPKKICSCIFDKMAEQLKAAEKNRALLGSSAFSIAQAEAIKSCVK